MSELDGATDEVWIDVGTVADVNKRKRVVLDVEGQQILVLAHDGEFFGFQHLCIHRQRELSKGVVLNGRLVCPGHQWAFDLRTGWEGVKQECQPTHRVRVQDDVVQVSPQSRCAVARATPAALD
jgi:nitrite reductase (NADH) small subunit